MSEAEDSPAFRAHVLEWLRREQGTEAVSVESVCGDSSTEEIAQSFYAVVFGVDVRYTTRDGEQRVMNVHADDMTSLWQWVVSGPDAPEPEPCPVCAVRGIGT